MIGCFSWNSPKIEIIDETPKRENFNYSKPKGTITYSMDRANILLIEINFDGWFENSVCLRPKNNRMTENFLSLERRPVPSPSISFSSDSGMDTVF